MIKFCGFRKVSELYPEDSLSNPVGAAIYCHRRCTDNGINPNRVGRAWEAHLTLFHGKSSNFASLLL